MIIFKRRKQFTFEEAKVLRELGVSSFDDIWERVGKDYDSGLSNLLSGRPAGTTLSIERLKEVLCDVGSLDVALPDQPKLGRVKYWLDACWRWRGRCWGRFKEQHLTAVALVMLLAAGALLVRALFFLDSPAVISARGIEAGHTLAEVDLRTAKLAPQRDAFGSASDLVGLRLANGVSPGQVIRSEHLLRIQVMVIKDVPLGAGLSNESIALGWSPYKPDAALSPQTVVGHKLRRALRSGEVVVKSDVE